MKPEKGNGQHIALLSRKSLPKGRDHRSAVGKSYHVVELVNSCATLFGQVSGQDYPQENRGNYDPGDPGQVQICFQTLYARQPDI